MLNEHKPKPFDLQVSVRSLMALFLGELPSFLFNLVTSPDGHSSMASQARVSPARQLLRRLKLKRAQRAQGQGGKLQCRCERRHSGH